MREKKTARRVAFTAVFTAFSAAFLYLASVTPSGQLGFMGIASLFGIAAVVEYGIPGGLLVFVGTAVLGLIIVPSKAVVAVYALFFGYYPVLKALTERLKSRFLERLVKLAAFNAALTVILFALKAAIFDFSFFGSSKWVLYASLNFVFVLFDTGVSRVIAAYMANIHPKIHKMQ